MNNDEAIKKFYELNKLILNKWLDQELFTFEWFFLVFLVLGCYLLFFYLLDKERIVEILLYGSFVAVAFVVYDSTGIFFGFWANKISISPIYPNVFISDLTVGPLIAMLIYQYKTSWSRFIRWSIIFTGIYIVVFFGFLLTYMEVFVYLKPYANIIDICSFLSVLIISRGVMVLILNKEAQKGNISAKHSLSKLSAKPTRK